MNEVLRQEKKYLMNAAAEAELRSQLDAVMIHDPHNGPQGYKIWSLYFDTADDKDLYDKVDGLELRRKIRLRIYDPNADFAMLEMKQKEGAYQKKRSLRLERSDAERLITGDYLPLQKYHEPFAAECYALMNMMCYRPKAVVEYARKAYIAKENRIRITIDSRISSNESDYNIFSPKLITYPVMDPFNSVLEVKYNGFLLSYIKEIVNAANRSEISVSKYSLARSTALGYEY